MSQIERLIITIVCSVSLASIALAQNADEEPEDGNATETQNEAPTDDAMDEEIDVDDGSYIDGEDDDFRPSEEIPADQSIDFPTDI